ncbi:MAG: ammonia-forming cytochrome c nitrite reductase subunit c552 [Fimbriimonadaceae bacterium]
MKNSKHFGWFVLAGSALGVFALGMLASSITERRSERAISRVQFMQPISKFESDNAVWGASFPREYNSWQATKQDKTLTKFGGSGFRDYLAENPNLVVMWAGYAFAKEYNAPRGHFHATDDVKNTDRRTAATPATCWTCKSPDVPRLMDRDGTAEFYAHKFDRYLTEIDNPIGCADCHNNETMALQISRPALKEAFQRMGKDIHQATHQEMRSLVCAQCHVEYYFKGKQANYLTFPWDDGMQIEDMEKYYDRTGHVDWVHAISGAEMIKMQHPDYELYSKGIHAYRGVSCADCHMPYKSEGGIKYTDHQVRSPLENIANSCQVCHRWSESEIRTRVEGIQTNNRQMLDAVEDAVTRLHLEIGDAVRLGASKEELAFARDRVRRAQMYWDYVAAANGMGFHAPQEAARILVKALNFASEGRLAIQKVRARKGALDPIRMPDISTKELAQAFIKPFVDAQKAPAPTPAKTAASNPSLLRASQAMAQATRVR